MVTIDGVGVPLAALVDEMTQSIDGEEGTAQLRKQSLFFMDPNKVPLIEKWVTDKERPQELTAILEKKLRPMLVTSIIAEHMVHEGNLFLRKYAKHQSAEVISRQTEIKMNVTNPEAIMAFDRYQTSAA